MIPVFTAIHKRQDILPVWLDALSATLTDDFSVNVFHTGEPKHGLRVSSQQIPHYGMTVSYVAFYNLMPQRGVRVFIEEDILPVREWSLSDYNGDFLFLEGSPGKGWPGIAFARGDKFAGKFQLIPQRPARVFGCPAWADAELCRLAVEADARFVGDHFVHLDKMCRQPPPQEIEQKNRLLDFLKARFSNDNRQRPSGLGDMVASALSAVGITKERVSKAIGKPCGCKKRQARLNELGRAFGIG